MQRKKKQKYETEQAVQERRQIPLGLFGPLVLNVKSKKENMSQYVGVFFSVKRLDGYREVW